jgi:hypothetical protein
MPFCRQFGDICLQFVDILSIISKTIENIFPNGQHIAARDVAVRAGSTSGAINNHDRGRTAAASRAGRGLLRLGTGTRGTVGQFRQVGGVLPQLLDVLDADNKVATGAQAD